MKNGWDRGEVFQFCGLTFFRVHYPTTPLHTIIPWISHEGIRGKSHSCKTDFRHCKGIVHYNKKGPFFFFEGGEGSYCNIIDFCYLLYQNNLEMRIIRLKTCKARIMKNQKSKFHFDCAAVKLFTLL